MDRKAVDADGEYTVVATYRYDGLGHRVKKVVTNSGGIERTDYYYYNSKWQLLEVDQGSTPATHKARQQFVWGTNYVDEAICMDVDTTVAGVRGPVRTPSAPGMTDLVAAVTRSRQTSELLIGGFAP